MVHSTFLSIGSDRKLEFEDERQILEVYRSVLQSTRYFVDGLSVTKVSIYEKLSDVGFGLTSANATIDLIRCAGQAYCVESFEFFTARLGLMEQTLTGTVVADPTDALHLLAWALWFPIDVINFKILHEVLLKKETLKGKRLIHKAIGKINPVCTYGIDPSSRWLAHFPVKLRYLSDHGHDINDLNEEGHSVLNLAILCHHDPRERVFIVQELLHHGASPSLCNSRCRIDQTPLGLAIKMKESRMVEVLLLAGANRLFEDDEHRTFFHLLLESESLQILEIFLAKPFPLTEIESRALALGSKQVAAFEAKEKAEAFNSNLQFCLDIFTKGLSAIQAAGNDGNSDVGLDTRISSVVTQLGSISIGQPI